jgi:transposase
MIVIPKQDILTIKKKFQPLSLVLNERSKRIWVATEAISYGKGGVTAVHKATSIARNTIYSGIKDIDVTNQLDISKLRQSGAGRKTLVSKNPNIMKDLEEVLESSSRGDPESPLRWTCKSVRNLETILRKKNYKISFRSICNLLKKLGYSLQSNGVVA